MQGTVPTSLPVQPQYPPQPGTIIVGASFGRDPTTMHCPHCKQQIQTSTRTKTGLIGKLYLFVRSFNLDVTKIYNSIYT